MNFFRILGFLALSLVLFLGLFSAEGVQAKPRVLVVISAVGDSSSGRPAEYMLNELAVPILKLRAVGFGVDIASGSDVIPAIIGSSRKPQLFASWMDYMRAHAWLERNSGGGKSDLPAPLPMAGLTDENLSQYSALYIPGGDGALGLAQNKDFAKILKYFWVHEKLIASVSEGTMSLLATADDPSFSIFAHRQLTGLSEEEALRFDPNRKYDWEKKLRSKNAYFLTQKPFEPYVVRDGLLISGQNSQSTELLSETLIEALSVQLLNNGRKDSMLKLNLWGQSFSENKNAEQSFQVLSSASAWNPLPHSAIFYFYGTRKGGLSRENFLNQLSEHINDVKAHFAPLGLEGYTVWSDGDLETAQLHWRSEPLSAAAMKTKDGKRIAKQVESIFEATKMAKLTDPRCLKILRELTVLD